MLFILFFLLVSNVYADIVVVYDPSTKEVYSISSENDAVVPHGYEESIINGNIEDYMSQLDAKDYKFTNGKLVANVKKINKREEARQKQMDEKEELRLIDSKMKKLAYEALKAEGKSFKHIKDQDFE